MIPGIHEIQSLATKYSKAQLAQMAQMGTIDPTKAVMAGMMIDRISKQNIEPPKSTVAQDVMAPPAPQAPQMGMPQGQPQQAPSAGVSGIPAPNMESMAGGGIVAFAEGGTADLMKQQVFDDYGLSPQYLTPAQEAESKASADRAIAKQKANAELQDIKSKYLYGNMPPEVAARVAELKASKPAATPAATPYIDATTKPAADTKASSQPRTQTGPRTDTGIGGLSKTMEEVSRASGMDDLKKQYAGLATEAEAANARERTLAGQRPEYTPYKKYEESLNKEATDAEGKKSENFKMALINAGLSIMGGKSQYALQNIAEGAQVGTKQYAEGIKDLDKAAKEREKAFAEIEQARNLYGEKKFDRAEAFEKSANDRIATARTAAITGLANVTGKTLDSATTIFDMNARNASAERVAGIQANIQRETNAMYKKDALDERQARTLIEASGKFLAENKDKPLYMNDPAKLQADAITYAKELAKVFMPKAGGATVAAPAGPRKQPIATFDK